MEQSAINPELNPLGLLTLDALEFAATSSQTKLPDLFHQLGFSETHQSKNLDYRLYSQGQVRFIVNTAKDTHADRYQQMHGEGVSKMIFKVENVEHALTEATRRGAKVVSDMKVIETEHGLIKRGAIQGFGDVWNEFIERPLEAFGPELSHTVHDTKACPLQQRISRIDHLTNNVPRGQLEHWVDFYQRIYGFKVTRYFDIKGRKTGLESKVVQLFNNQIIIPINEPDTDHSKSQIQEFLDLHKGPGVQHIALMTADIIKTVGELRSRDVGFLEVPDTYYDGLAARGLHVTEDIAQLMKNQILVDGDKEGYLLQIFSDTCVGPLFFEYIQRKNHWGFGEGNFQALFDAIEKDQMKRGYIK
jgi:4-hydroxyphenylpyruvate dioxygenase